MEQDKFVINIGRQLGSGGKAVGEALGRRLGVHVYDKQLINLAAEQSGLCTELFEQADEKKSRSLFSSLIGYLRMPFGGAECGMTDVLSSEALFKIQSDVIRDIASRESCIFVGRCADYILRDHPRAVNVFVTGAPEDRVRRLCEQENVTRPKRPKRRWSVRMPAGLPITTISAAASGAKPQPTISASIPRCWGSKVRPTLSGSSRSVN